MKEKVREVEGKGPSERKPKFIAAKHMLPRTLDKQDDWKQWKSEVEDYCEVVMEGTKDIMEEIRKQKRGEFEQNCGDC